MSYKLCTHANIIKYQDKKTNEDGFPFLISEFNTVNRKYQQFKWISVPSEGESSMGPNTQKLFFHIQQCRHEKVPKKEEFFQCCGTLF